MRLFPNTDHGNGEVFSVVGRTSGSFVDPTFQDLHRSMLFGVPMETQYFVGESGIDDVSVSVFRGLNDGNGGNPLLNQDAGSLDPSEAEANGSAYSGLAYRNYLAGQFLLWPHTAMTAGKRESLALTQGDREWSLFVAVNTTGATSFTPGLCGARRLLTGANDGSWILARQLLTNNLLFFFTSTTGGQAVSLTGAWALFGTVSSFGYHSICFTRESGGVYTIYVDGVFAATATNAATSAVVAPQEGLTLGAHSHFTTPAQASLNNQNLLGEYAGFYIFDRAITTEEMAALHQDPQGPFRLWGPPVESFFPIVVTASAAELELAAPASAVIAPATLAPAPAELELAAEEAFVHVDALGDLEGGGDVVDPLTAAGTTEVSLGGDGDLGDPLGGEGDAVDALEGDGDLVDPLTGDGLL